jgi:hypothetical protein
MAYTCPSAPLSGDMSRVPPRRLSELPMVEAVTSMLCPGLANGGSVAVRVTAATFLSCGRTESGTDTPNWLSMLRRLCTVKGTWPVWSPVPSRPTTSP